MIVRSKILIALLMMYVTMTACSRDGGGGSSTTAPVNSPVSPSPASSTQSVSLSYEMNDSDCKTGDLKFDSQAALCAGLQNNALNNNCALRSRAAYFSEVCPNQTFSPIDDQLAHGQPHSIQITVLNFLMGGRENCDVKNKIFVFSATNQKVETPICENSQVRVSASSQDGVVTFHATEVNSGRELPPKDAISESAHFILGKSKGMLRYGVENPHGFTYVMAEEVTGYDPVVLAQVNDLNVRAASLRAEILTALQAGKKPSPKTINALRQIEAEAAILSDKLVPEKATN